MHKDICMLEKYPDLLLRLIGRVPLHYSRTEQIKKVNTKVLWVESLNVYSESLQQHSLFSAAGGALALFGCM